MTTCSLRSISSVPRRKRKCFQSKRMTIENSLPLTTPLRCQIFLPPFKQLSSHNSSSWFSDLIAFSCSIRPITSTPLPPIIPSPKPSLCRADSSSSPGRLARCFFSGLPMMDSSRSLGALRSCGALVVNRVGGVTALLDTSGGVDPLVGVFDAGDFRVTTDP